MVPDILMVKITCDVGGTFTDVVVSDTNGRLALGKSLTTPQRLADGLLSAIDNAAQQLDLDGSGLLARCDLFVFSTTRATNAILEGKTARTALLVTEGFPDVLVRREGGSMHPYDFSQPYPEPYVPRELTFEIRERVAADGETVRPLDEDHARAVLRGMVPHGVEAVAVCLLWSTVDGAHERRLGELLAEELPGVPFTLSHQLNPILREYRRASGAAIDASLKRLLPGHLTEVDEGLRASGFTGELLAATSVGGVLPMAELAAKPVLAAKSGPSLAPVAGRLFVDELDRSDIIVCDTGGTSFDVSLIRAGDIVTTRETWLGGTFTGHLTGLSSVDVRSIGAGGGSVAWVDAGGLLRVGPESAGADPGPACYGNGGHRPTVTDAALLLGYLDPERFLGGRMQLDAAAAERVLSDLAEELGSTPVAAAEAVMTIANQHMVDAIKAITIDQGIDPRASGIVAGGGAAGLGIAAIADALDCDRVVMPRAAGALSAFGGQYSDILVEEGRTVLCDSADGDFTAADAAFAEIDAVLATSGATLRDAGVVDQRIERSVEARYAHQAWTLPVPLPFSRFAGPEQVTILANAFHATHERVFAVSDSSQRVEVVHCVGRLRAAPAKPPRTAGAPADEPPTASARRTVTFPGAGAHEASIWTGGGLGPGAAIDGPALVVEPTTTIVVPPGWSIRVTAIGDYLLERA
ncbi:MAG: hydantoinase/oxoprolinase family protein [Patulibacter sp.]